MTLPLWRRRVVVTRPRRRATGWVEGFAKLGAEVIIFPTIDLTAVPRVEREVRLARLRELEDEDAWIAVTSPSSAEFLLQIASRERELLARFRFAAVGAATRKVLETAGIAVALEASRLDGESLAEALVERADARIVLHASSDDPSDTLGVRLGERAEAFPVSVREELRPDFAPLLPDLFAGELDLLTFASPSSATSFLDAAPESARDAFRAVCCLAIGRVTAARLGELGFGRVETSDSPTLDRILDTAVRALARA